MTPRIGLALSGGTAKSVTHVGVIKALTETANKLKADGTSGGIFDRSWTVSLNDTPRVGLRTVTVTVAWTDSRSHSTQVASYVRCSTIPCS